MNERIRAVRESLGLSRAAFGEKLGVSGDVINNLERGRVAPKENITKLICKEFNVNENWIKTGNGDMFDKTENEIEQIAEEYGLSPAYAAVMEKLLKLSRPAQDEIVEAVLSIVDRLKDTPFWESDPQRAARLLREEADAVEQGGGVSSALPFTDDTESDCG